VALYLFVHYASLVAGGASAGIVLAALLLIPALFLGLGLRDRMAAIVLGSTGTLLNARDASITNPQVAYLGLLPLVMALFPAAPYGSLARRGEVDPGSKWRSPAWVHAAAWMLLGLGYGYFGFTRLGAASWMDGTALRSALDGPLARPGFVHTILLLMPDALMQVVTWATLGVSLAFLPLAMIPKLAPWVWGLGLVAQLCILVTTNSGGVAMGIVLLHLFAFNPGWLPPLPAAGSRVFYDGHCGLCHGVVRFLLSEDRNCVFRFAPLQGETFQSAVPESRRAGLPDSVIVLTREGQLLSRSSAVIFLLERLGGLWRALAAVVRMIPSGLCDRLYDGIAGTRHRLFGRPADACPLLPNDLRTLFDG
jgi:predicted DCC family thiol-disulfide oxidoreductase YuxK